MQLCSHFPKAMPVPANEFSWCGVDAMILTLLPILCYDWFDCLYIMYT